MQTAQLTESCAFSCYCLSLLSNKSCIVDTSWKNQLVLMISSQFTWFLYSKFGENGWFIADQWSWLWSVLLRSNEKLISFIQEFATHTNHAITQSPSNSLLYQHESRGLGVSKKNDRSMNDLVSYTHISKPIQKKNHFLLWNSLNGLWYERTYFSFRCI